MERIKNLGLILISVLLTLVAVNIPFWFNEKWKFFPEFPALNLSLEQRDLEGIAHFKARFEQEAPVFNTKYLSVRDIADGEISESTGWAGLFTSGLRLKSNVTVRSTKKLVPSARIIYDVNYTLDGNSRRLTIPENKGAKKTVLLLGDSFTFGEGVNDNETHAAFLAQHRPDIRVLNLGLPSAGPNDFLDMDESYFQNLVGDVQGEVTVIFNLIRGDLDRAVCEFECFKIDNKWMLKKTRYQVLENKLSADGKFREQKLRTSLMTAVAELPLVKYLKVRIPLTLWDDDAKLLARMFKEIDGRLRKYIHVKNFVVAYMPYGGQRMLRALNDPMAAQGLSVWDFTTVNMGEVVSGRLNIPGDGHPTPEAHYVYSMMLEEKLKAQGF